MLVPNMSVYQTQLPDTPSPGACLQPAGLITPHLHLRAAKSNLTFAPQTTEYCGSGPWASENSCISCVRRCSPLHSGMVHCSLRPPDLYFVFLQVATLYNLCKALQSFHSRGMVHCSLSPPDFSWYQGGQGWKVASCGDWAQQGMHVRSCYALRYASPEVTQ